MLTEVPDAHQVDGHVDWLVVVGGVEHELLAEVEHASALAAHFATLFCTWIWAAHWEMSQSSLYLQPVFSTNNTTQHTSALCTMSPDCSSCAQRAKISNWFYPVFLKIFNLVQAVDCWYDTSNFGLANILSNQNLEENTHHSTTNFFRLLAFNHCLNPLNRYRNRHPYYRFNTSHFLNRS